MNPGKRYGKWLVPVICLVFTIISGSQAQSSSELPAEIPEVTIDGKKVERSYFETLIKFKSIQVRMLHSTLSSEQLMRRSVNEIVDRVIIRELLIREAARVGFDVPQKNIIRHMENNYRNFGGRESLMKLLDESGISAEDYEEMVRRSYIITEFFESTLPVPLVHSGEVRKYYEQNTREFSDPDLIEFDLLRITFQKNMESEEEFGKWGKMASNRKDRSGFVELADQISEASISADRIKRFYGTTVRSSDRGIMYPLLDSLSPSDIAIHRLTNAGGRQVWLLVHVLRTQPGTRQPFADVREKILRNMAAKKKDRLLQEKTSELRAGSAITIAD